MNHAKPPWHVVAWLHCIAWSQVLRKNIRGMADGKLPPIPGTIEHLSNRLCLIFFAGFTLKKSRCFKQARDLNTLAWKVKTACYLFVSSDMAMVGQLQGICIQHDKYHTMFLHNSSFAIVDTLPLLNNSYFFFYLG